MKIFVTTHKKTEFPKLPSIYKIIQVNAINNEDFGYDYKDSDNDNISIKNSNYCELTAQYWIYKNIEEDIVGIVHYRRYFVNHLKSIFSIKLLDEKKIRKILNRYDMIVPRVTYLIGKANGKKHRNFYEQYSYNHYQKDLDNTKKVIAMLCPEYLNAFDYVSKMKRAPMLNMLICKKELFDSYSKWLFNILFEVEKISDLSNYDNYQKRIYGFLSEFLINVFIIKNNIQIKKMVVYNSEQNVFISWAKKFIAWIKIFKI